MPRGKSIELSPSQYRALRRLYDAGYSVRELAEMSWRQLGFGSAFAAQEHIYRRFKTLGYRRRDRSAAQKIRYSRQTCKGCGGKFDEHTPGCATCSNRLICRRYNNSPLADPSPRLFCRKCGCGSEEYTRGCHTCSSRHSKRKRRTARALSETG